MLVAATSALVITFLQLILKAGSVLAAVDLRRCPAYLPTYSSGSVCAEFVAEGHSVRVSVISMKKRRLDRYQSCVEHMERVMAPAVAAGVSS